MKIIYHENYNIDVGILKFLHPFDGLKFSKVRNATQNLGAIAPEKEISEQAILKSMNELLKIQIKDKAALCRALEIPKIPFLSLDWLDKKILAPMRWGVGGTLAASRLALNGENAWNLAGGYHHASPHKMEGFCIYNDIGISYQQLIASGEITADDKILIIDIDAHHGNGNARTFMDNANVTLLDIYNADIYPLDRISRRRVNIAVPLPTGTGGELYLNKLEAALNQLIGGYKLAYVVAGTDVLATDPLGGLQLSVADVAQCHKRVYQRLKQLDIPTVFVGGGGYGKDSANAIIAGITAVTDAC